ncbi:hypothetical protein Leryth_024568 [Lithospermum erythrorhizon]|nr:hypothetical protein Leryth_024568 [Lithospermum erythrorhizon]
MKRLLPSRELHLKSTERISKSQVLMALEEATHLVERSSLHSSKKELPFSCKEGMEIYESAIFSKSGFKNLTNALRHRGTHETVDPVRIRLLWSWSTFLYIGASKPKNKSSGAQ